MTPPAQPWRYRALYYLSWGAFGVVGLALNLGCLALMPLPRTKARMRWVRRTIQRLFDLWLRWLHLTGIVKVRWHGFHHPLPEGAIYIANHPTLVDATMLLARLPNAICIFKPSLMRNPAIGPAAIMAGYVAGDSGVDLVRELTAQAREGKSLLIFPEGTRTAPGKRLEPLRPGFALIASRAGAPVTLLVIKSSPGITMRGRPWWQLPSQLPGTIDITLERTWEPDAVRSPLDLVAEVEAHLQSKVSEVIA